MRLLAELGILGALLGMGMRASSGTVPTVQPNRNVERAGVLRHGVLTVALEAKASRFWPHGPHRPSTTIEAFAEPGRAPQMPGPLLRMPAGTELRLAVRNSLATPLTFYVSSEVAAGSDRVSTTDSIVVAPGAVGHLVWQAKSPGNYVYRATTPAAAVDRVTLLAGALGGALIVDSAGAPRRPNDRVFVIMTTPDSDAVAHIDRELATGRIRPGSPLASGGPSGFEGIAFTINGRAWPNTERIAATAGDSLHWRVINLSPESHPMHLHGFYYRVDAFDEPGDDHVHPPAPGQMVVTQLLPPLAGMSMAWSPTRPGNWIFHCHFALHNMPDSMSAMPDGQPMRDMTGLVIGVNVAARRGVRVAAFPANPRRIRLVATLDSAHTIGVLNPPGRYIPEPMMRFVLEEGDRRVDTKRAFSPEIDLTRGEPITITIVNHLPRATSVHWHGIEVQDSYMDGVPGVSGDGPHLTPEIAPGDSFEARFTPPRSGTFMYHAHIDEPREEQVGLEGALIVRDPGAPPSPDDHDFFFKGGGINGVPNPDTVVLHTGRPARLRFFNLANWEVLTAFTLTARPDSAVRLANDTSLVRWRPLAKDGFDLPASQRLSVPARQIVSMGETYDFEYTPERPGLLRLELRGPAGQLIFRVPIRVE